MCLAVPGKILEKFDEAGLPMGQIDYAGARNKACLVYTPEAEIGDYVIVHAGFALNVINEEEAAATLQELERLAAFMDADAKTAEAKAAEAKAAEAKAAEDAEDAE